MRYGWATILLAPALIAQGRYVRRKTEKLPEPKGERVGCLGNGPALRLLIVGDSAGAGVGCDDQEEALLGQLTARLSRICRVNFRLEANTGDTTQECLDKLRQLPSQEFDVVITSLGVNDVTSSSTAYGFRKRQSALVQEMKTRFSAKLIILSGLPPMSHFPALPNPLRWYLGERANQFDRIVAGIALLENTDYIAFEFDGDNTVMARDGFHPGPRVYAQWADLVFERIVAKRIHGLKVM